MLRSVPIRDLVSDQLRKELLRVELTIGGVTLTPVGNDRDDEADAVVRRVVGYVKEDQS